MMIVYQHVNFCLLFKTKKIEKITPKSLDVHPIENALIIHCEAEVSVVNDGLENDNCLVEKSKNI